MAARTTLPGSGGAGDSDGSVLHASHIDTLPGGLCGYKYSAGGGGGTTVTSLATIDSVTFTANASRMYLAEVWGTYQVASGNVLTMSVADNGLSELDHVDLDGAAATSIQPFKLEVLTGAVGAGSTTLYFRSQRTTGSGTCKVLKYLFRISELAPNF